MAHSQVLNLPLNIRAEDGQYSKLILVTPVFEFRNDSVANPLDVSAAITTDKVVWTQSKLPDMNKNYRSGFAWIFDGASEMKGAKSYTLLAIENPSWTAFPCRIWTDKNHNYDFTDDGDPLVIYTEKGAVLHFGENKNGYEVYLEHFPSEKFRDFELMNDKAIEQLRGNRTFVGTAGSLRERRMNVVAANWNNGADSFCIGIKDANCNGKYDDAGIDVALITNYNGVFDNLQGIKVDVNGEAYLEWRNAAYTIQKVSEDGQFLIVKRDTASRLKFSLNVGDKLPRFKYCTATKPSKHKSIRRLKGQYVYIYVWRDGVDGFINDSADWHAIGRLKNPNVATLGLNYGGSARYVYQYNNYFETAILQGYSSNDINKELKIKEIPTGILIDKKQRIVAIGVTPAQAMLLLPTK